MCGIFGYYNFRVARDRRAILEFLFTGLRRLEYRGYDSAGEPLVSGIQVALSAAWAALVASLNLLLSPTLQRLPCGCLLAVL